MLRFLKALLVFVILLTFGGNSQAQDNDTQEIPGTIAYIGDDLNVYTVDPATGERTMLTDDAAMTEESYRYYRWPTWSNDGRLAYFAVSDGASAPYLTEIFVSPDGTTPGKRIYSGESEIYNYASWAPANCNDTDNCRILAVLMSERGRGLFVEAIKDEVAGNPTETIGRGGPFYYSWSTDAREMLWQRNNRSLDIYSVDDNTVQERLSQEAGTFQAPHWSPTDRRLLLGISPADRETTDISVIEDGSEQILASDLEGVVAFAWSPDGSRVAYVDDRGPLLVVDSANGDVISETVIGGVISFFWSPDSQKLAYITLAVPPDSATAKNGLTAAQVQRDISLAWSVLDVDTGEVTRYDAFTPTQEMVYMFTYFDQFAQSHRVWSPDSRYLTYGATIDEEPSIQILDTRVDDAVPRSLAGGTLPIWSFD